MSAEIGRAQGFGNPLAEPTPFLELAVATASGPPQAFARGPASKKAATLISRLEEAVLRWLEEEL